MNATDTARAARGLVRVTIWLPASLLLALDELVGRRGRAKWVRRSIREAVKK